MLKTVVFNILLITAAVVLVLPGPVFAADQQPVLPLKPAPTSVKPDANPQTTVPQAQTPRVPLSRVNLGQLPTDFSSTAPDSQILGQLRQFSAGVPIDINAHVQYVFRESCKETQKDLENLAQKVKRFNSMKDELRGYLDDLRSVSSKLVSRSEDSLRRYECNVYLPSPRPPMCPPPGALIPPAPSQDIPPLITRNIKLLDLVDGQVASLDESSLDNPQQQDLERFRDVAGRYRRLVERYGRLYGPVPDRPPPISGSGMAPVDEKKPMVIPGPASMPVIKQTAPAVAPSVTRPPPVTRPVSPGLMKPGIKK